MITLEQIQYFAKLNKIDESTVAREYFQILFLNELYSQKFSENVYFKGGTAIRLVYKGKRFSEDLDFTVMYDEAEFKNDIEKFFKQMEKKYVVSFKPRDSITGKTYLATFELVGFKTKLYIKLDFSFRENVILPIKKIIQTDFPIVTSSFINTLEINEIISEKVRALMTREKQRDLYDLWILLQLGGTFDLEIINKKLNYYSTKFDTLEFINRLEIFSQKEFVKDLKAFVTINERDNLPGLHTYIKEYLKSIVTERLSQ